MKNLTSKFLLAVGLVGAAFCASAQTPTYNPVTLVNSVALNGSTATNFGTTSGGVVAFVGNQAKVAVSIITTNTKADAVNANILYYQRSVKGSSNTFETTLNPIGWTTTGTGINPAAPLVILTNLDTLGAGYINFPYLTNVAGSTTNVGYFNLSYGLKVSSP